MHETWLGPLRPPRGAPRDASFAAEARVTEHPLSARAAPRPAGRRRLQRPELYYVGRRPAATEVHIVSRTELEPLPHLNYQSGVPLDLGCWTAGALELAFAMLAHTTESRPTNLVCRTFCGEIVACLDPASCNDETWFLIATTIASTGLLTSSLQALGPGTLVSSPHPGVSEGSLRVMISRSSIASVVGCEFERRRRPGGFEQCASRSRMALTRIR
jgi:hypothetical protein